MSQTPEVPLTLASLTLKDRIPHPYILANQILTIQRAILNLENSTQITQEAVEGLIHTIPDLWKDDQYKKDLKEAYKEEDIDIRPQFCGNKASLTFCQKHKIETVKKRITLQYWQGLQACINLLDRKGMLSRKTYMEMMTGIPASEGEEDLTIVETKEL
jgi:tRNA splicing ligase